jgi:hypothetical protein
VIHADEIEGIFKNETGLTVEKDFTTNSDSTYIVSLTVKTDESSK